MVHVRRGAILHDIGKMAIPDSILLKSTDLTDSERAVIQQHPRYAYDMLSPIPYLRQALDIPFYHHEKWDGTGYPHGLKGEQIPLSARLFSVVDVFDAITSDRPYRPAWSMEKALDYILDQSGKYFDPNVVVEFMKIVNEDKYRLFHCLKQKPLRVWRRYDVSAAHRVLREEARISSPLGGSQANKKNR